MYDPVLKINGLDAFYGDVQVLWGVSLEIYLGEIVAVFGPNGAGKSTLMRTVMGLVEPKGQSGPVINYNDQVLDGLHTEEVVKRGITLVPEGARIFPDMTCLDNLKLGAYSIKDRHLESDLLDKVLELFPSLGDRQHKLAKTLSGGERQQLAFGRALMSDPKFVLLDEPTLGLHPLMASSIFNTIEKIKESGVTVLLVEQKVSLALKVTDRGYILENGRVVLTGQGRELMGNEHVRRAYMSV